MQYRPVMSQLQSWEWEFTHSYQSKHNRILASESGLWTYYKPMIDLFGYHADVAHWNVYIYVYIHTMYTHIYTHNVYTYIHTQCIHIYIHTQCIHIYIHTQCIHIYIHTMYTHIYTQTHTCSRLCTRIYFRAAHWWDDKTPKLFRCESLQVPANYRFHQRTPLLAPRVYPAPGTVRHHAHFTELRKNLWLTCQAQRAHSS